MADTIVKTTVLGPQTAAALGTVTGVRGKSVLVKIITSGSETISAAGLVRADVSTTGKIMFFNIATHAVHSTADMDDGTFYLEKCYTDTLTFTGSSTSDTKTVHVVVFD